MNNPYPIEYRWPDIKRYAEGNTGVPYVWSFDSGKPGRHVMANAVTHGNDCLLYTSPSPRDPE